MTTLRHPVFMAGIFIAGILQFELMVYATIGSFLVENILQRSAIVYGNTALLGSCGYLAGTLVNRLLIKKLSSARLTDIGFVLLVLSSLLQISFALFSQLNLFTLVFPLMLIGFSSGFIFPNTLGRSLKLFAKNIGIATAVLTCLLMAIGAVGVFVISHINIVNLTGLAITFAVAIILQLLVYYLWFNSRNT